MVSNLIYFFSKDKCPTVIKSFFENPIFLLVATFLSLQSELFSSVICGLEGENISVIEVKIQVDSLVEKLKGRKEGNFITSKERLLLDILKENGLLTENEYCKYKCDFYSTCIVYIKECSKPTFDKFNGISWLTLKNIECNFINFINYFIVGEIFYKVFIS